MKKIPGGHLLSPIWFPAVVLSIAFFNAFWHLDGPDLENPRPDVARYRALAEGRRGEVEAPFRYRVWTPALVSLLPAPPQRWLDPQRPADPQRTHFRFAVVNAAGLALAALALRRLTRRLTGADGPAVLAALLFLASYHPWTLGTLPMVEAWSWFFLAASLVALLERRSRSLALLFALGLTCKETTLLVLPAAALLPGCDRGQRVRQAAALLPAALAYALWRLAPGHEGAALYTAASTRRWLHDLFVSGERLGPNALRAALAFHVLWIPAALAWWRRRREPTALVRWAWWVPGVLVLPFALALLPGRVWFYAFPIVLPLAATGLYDFIRPAGARAPTPDRSASRTPAAARPAAP